MQRTSSSMKDLHLLEKPSRASLQSKAFSTLQYPPLSLKNPCISSPWDTSASCVNPHRDNFSDWPWLKPHTSRIQHWDWRWQLKEIQILVLSRALKPDARQTSGSTVSSKNNIISLILMPRVRSVCCISIFPFKGKETLKEAPRRVQTFAVCSNSLRTWTAVYLLAG